MTITVQGPDQSLLTTYIYIYIYARYIAARTFYISKESSVMISAFNSTFHFRNVSGSTINSRIGRNEDLYSAPGQCVLPQITLKDNYFLHAKEQTASLEHPSHSAGFSSVPFHLLNIKDKLLKNPVMTVVRSLQILITE
jgi:hypothetical protein